MTETIYNIEINEDSTMPQRTVEHLDEVRSIDVDQTSGKYAVTSPRDESGVLGGNVTIYPPSPALVDINIPVVIKDFRQVSSLNGPFDSRFDYVRRKLWIADAGNSRVLKVNIDTSEVETLVPNTTYPHAMAANVNRGGVFVKAYVGNSDVGVVYRFSSNGSELARYTYADNRRSTCDFDTYPALWIGLWNEETVVQMMGPRFTPLLKDLKLTEAVRSTVTHSIVTGNYQRVWTTSTSGELILFSTCDMDIVKRIDLREASYWPFGVIAIDSGGDLWVGNTDRILLRLSSEGGVKNSYTYTVERGGASAISIDLDDNIWLVHSDPDKISNKLFRIQNSDGSVLDTFELPSAINDIAIDRNNNVWATQTSDDLVYMLDSSDDYNMTAFQTGDNPVNLVVGLDDSVWISNQGAASLTRYIPSGGTYSRVDYQADDYPGASTVDRFGNIWVTYSYITGESFISQYVADDDFNRVDFCVGNGYPGNIMAADPLWLLRSTSESSSSESSSSVGESSEYMLDFSVRNFPSPSSIVYDHVRSRVWWVANNVVYMADQRNQQVSSFDLEGFDVVDLKTIDVELSTGNALVVGRFVGPPCVGGDVVAQVSRDNNKFLGYSYIESNGFITAG